MRIALLMTLLVSATASGQDLLAVDQAMTALVTERVHAASGEHRVRQLLDALLDQDGAGIIYDKRSRTAAQALESGRANCLSFSALVVTLGRLAGLDVEFELVLQPPLWDQVGDLTIRNEHVRAVVRLPDRHIRVDFLPDVLDRRRHGRRLDDRRARAHLLDNLGAEAFTAGHRLAAIARFEAAIEVDPRLVSAWTNLGVARRAAGDLAGAEEAHRMALDLEPDFPTARLNLLALLIGERRFQEAREELTRIQPYREKNPWYHYNLARHSVAVGANEEALGQVRRALRRQPREPRFLALKGLLLERLGRHRSARRALRKGQALSAEPASWRLLVAELLLEFPEIRP